MILSEHIEYIEDICSFFGWHTNRLRQFNRALKMYRQIDSHLKLELTKLDIQYE